MKLAIYLAFKYTRSKFNKGFLSFSAWVTIIGIGLGIAALILTSAIMSGLQSAVTDKLYAVYDQIVVYPNGNNDFDWRKVNQSISQNKFVEKVSPFIDTYGLLQAHNAAYPVLIRGVDPSLEHNVNSFLEDVDLSEDLKQKRFNFIAANSITRSLNIDLDRPIRLMLPKFQSGIIANQPIQKNIYLKNTIRPQFGLNQQLIYMNLNDVMLLLRQDQPTGFKVKTIDFESVEKARASLQASLPNFNVVDWSQNNQLWIENLMMQKRVFSIFLFLLILVSMFSLIANLTMLVVEKKSEIAILKTLGADDNLIIMVFVFMGLILTLIGISLGATIGLLLVHFMGPVSHFLENLFQIKFFSPQLWPVDFVPTKLVWSEISLIIGSTFLIASSVTLIPARRATKVEPSTLLSYNQ